MSELRPGAPARAGVTLVELLVVLILLGLAASLIAPALIPPRHDEAGLRVLVERARASAARRGEVIYVSVDPRGLWRMEGAASGLVGPLATGRVASPFAGPVTLVVSPLGSCAFDTRSAALGRAVALDPLTCELRQR